MDHYLPGTYFLLIIGYTGTCSVINARGYIQDEEMLADYGTTTRVSISYFRYLMIRDAIKQHFIFASIGTNSLHAYM